MLPFPIHLQDGEPVSDQIVRAATRALLRGELRPGDLFPSVRQLSMDLKVSPTTAHKSLAALKSAGLLTSRPGVGMVVTTPSNVTSETGRLAIAARCEDLLRDADTYGLSLQEVIETLRETQQRIRPNTPQENE